MTCRVGEEDKLAREGLEKRRIMGLRRESLIFILLVGALLNGYQDRGKERWRDRKRHDRQIAALHAPHIEEGFSHTWTHKDKHRHTHSYVRKKEQSVYTVWVRNTLPCDGLFV